MTGMVKQITEGVAISVETFFQQAYSKPIKRAYRFAFQITVENNNSFPIRLLKRRCFIVDSHSTKRKEIEGEGVGGIFPLILPGATYCYASSANLSTGLGKMYGIFLIENQKDKSTFDAIIPEFKLEAPLKLN